MIYFDVYNFFIQLFNLFFTNISFFLMLYCYLEHFVKLTISYYHMPLSFGFTRVLVNDGITDRYRRAMKTYFQFVVLLSLNYLSQHCVPNYSIYIGLLVYFFYKTNTLIKDNLNSLDQALEDARNGYFIGRWHVILYYLNKMFYAYNFISIVFKLGPILFELFTNHKKYFIILLFFVWFEIVVLKYIFYWAFKINLKIIDSVNVALFNLLIINFDIGIKLLCQK